MALNNGLPTCDEVKKIDLVDYLGSLAHYPTNVTGSNYWYLSPLPERHEATASFHVDRHKNVWYDHGIGLGGTIIDFGTRYFKCSIRGLLEKFKDFPGIPHIEEPEPQTIHHTRHSKVEIQKISSIRSPFLFLYLKERMIPVSLAVRYLVEVNFTIHFAYTALGFKNNSGGWELRNPSMKVSASPKDATIYKNGSNKLAVFEGWTDWLTFLSLCPASQIHLLDYLILNSLSFLRVYLVLIESYDMGLLYFDHDAAGRAATHQAMTASKSVKDRSAFYNTHKDLNLWRTRWGPDLRLNLLEDLF
jgi:hypothetical protein